MGMIIPFFQRQTLVGAGAWVTYLSDPFDVSDYATVNADVQILGLIGTFPSILVSLETADSLNTADSGWIPKSSFATFTGAPSGASEVLGAPTPTGALSRFVRAKVQINPADKVVTLSVIGVARESS